MLDQNTDRMWYVIGAVLIGAAIIMIANGSLPQMFASVTDSFENVGDEAVAGLEVLGAEDENTMTDGITPEGPNIIDASDMTLEEYIISLVPNYPPENLELVRTPHHAYYSTTSEVARQYFNNNSQEYDMYNLHGTDFYRQVDPEGDVGTIMLKDGDRVTHVYVRNTLAKVEQLESDTISGYSEYYGSDIRQVKLANGTYYQLVIEYE